MGYKLAVVGATGNVGREILSILDERAFPVDEVVALASERSIGREVSFGEERTLMVQDLSNFDFAGTDIVLSSPGARVSARHSPWAAAAGAVVIDNTSHFRMEPDVPLVVPEVNAHAIRDHQGILASPNCSTTQMVVAMKPLHDAARIRRVIVSTYQATSGAGVAGQRDLDGGSRAALDGEDDYEYEAFAHPIAFNVIPQIGSPKHEGYTSEEMKMVHETRKILEDNKIGITVTTVRVPVVRGHSEAVNIEDETLNAHVRDQAWEC